MTSFDRPNKGFEYGDLPDVMRHPVYDELMGLIDAYTREGFALSSRGTLAATNLNDASGVHRRHTMHYIRAWEYVRLVVIGGLADGAAKQVLCLGEAATPLLFYCASRGHQVTVVDINKELIDHTAMVAARKQLPMITRCDDMTRLPFSDGAFDTVVSCSVIEHLPKEKRRAAIKEMARVLSPSGRIALSFDYGTYAGRPLTGETHETITYEEMVRVLVPTSACVPLGRECEQTAERPWTLKRPFWKWLRYYPSPWNIAKRFFYAPLPYSYYTLFLVKGSHGAQR